MRKVFIGFDPRDWGAYQVAVESLKAKSNVRIIPVIERELRRTHTYTRPYRVDENGQMWDERDQKPFSTQFSFTRFCVPMMAGYADEWVLFVDADVMFRRDVEELFALADDRYAVMCVQHHHEPSDQYKMDGVLQTRYRRKNWSSVMLMNPSKCSELNQHTINQWPGSALHGMDWTDEIGALPPEWNWLDGERCTIPPKLVHYTRGTPDMIDGCAFEDEWWMFHNWASVRYPLSGARKDAAA